MSTEISSSHKNLKRSKETLLRDLKRVVGDADELLQEMSNATVDEFSTARNRFEARLDEARARVVEARILVGNKACCAAKATNTYLRENPCKAVGMASVIGLIAAFLFVRRSPR